MRKQSARLATRHYAALTGAALVLAACGHDSRSKPAPESAVGTGFATTAVAAPAALAIAKADEGVVASARVANAAEASPAPRPATPAAQGTPDLAMGAPLPPASDPAGAMLVRHGQASVEVRHVDDAVTRIRQTAQQFGGFVANTALRNGKDEHSSATLELRVPTAQFDGLLGALRTLGKVETVTATAEDVGEEVLHVEPGFLDLAFLQVGGAGLDDFEELFHGERRAEGKGRRVRVSSE